MNQIQPGIKTKNFHINNQPGVFEGDISVVGDMRIYMNANLEGGKGVKQSRGATRTLPLWKMYKSGSNYIVPYVVSNSIGIYFDLNNLNIISYTILVRPISLLGKVINFFFEVLVV